MPELVQLLGGQTLADLDRQGKLFDFLKARQYQGAPLLNRLGGWLKQALPFRGTQVACYHKEWDYFSREFRRDLLRLHRAEAGHPAHAAARAGDHRRHEGEAHSRCCSRPTTTTATRCSRSPQRTGAKAVIVPSNTGGAAGINTYFDLMNLWITELGRAFGASAGAAAN